MNQNLQHSVGEKREHVLVCLSASPSNPRIISTAARMAGAFQAEFTALYVKTPRQEVLSEDNQRRLQDNIRMAEQLGAKVETLWGDDVPYQIAEYARISGITKIVMGRSAVSRTGLIRKPSVTDRVIQFAPNLDVHIIPDAENTERPYYSNQTSREKVIFSWMDLCKCMMILLAASVIGFLFEALGLKDTNIVAVYILGVLMTAIVTSHQIYSVAEAVLSVLAFNFFFTNPRLTFAVHDTGYPITFVIMFIVGILSSSLAIRLKENARQSARAAYRTRILFDTNQLLQQATEDSEIIGVAVNQLIKLLNRSIILYPVEKNILKEPVRYDSDTEPETMVDSPENRQIAQWVLEQRKRAGAGTDHFPKASYQYLAIRAGSTVYGIVGIPVNEKSLDAFENSILLSILGECAMALENARNAREKEEAAILAKNEQLRSNLLRSISHDLRTPLTSISGNASNLLSNWKDFNEETVMQLFTDIYDDSMWLIDLVENLLAVTRLEEGQLRLHRNAELLEDIIEEAMRHLHRKKETHSIQVELEEDFLLVRTDARLIVQLLINLLDNALKYTPEDSQILLHACKIQGDIHIQVSDNGPGIPDEKKEKVFEMFYCGANEIGDSRRSLGLGLALCRSIVTAHGGEIWVEDAKPHGACFHLTLPVGDMEIHE